MIAESSFCAVFGLLAMPSRSPSSPSSWRVSSTLLLHLFFRIVISCRYYLLGLRLHLLGFLVSDIGQHLSQTPFIGIIGVQGRSNAVFTFEGLHIFPQQNGFFICHSASDCGYLILNGLEHGCIDRLGEDFIRALKRVDAVDQVNIQVVNVDEFVSNIEKFLFM